MNDPILRQSLRAKLLWATSPSDIHYLNDGVVSIDSSGRIASVLPFNVYKGDPPKQLPNTVLVPGFVDTHLHYPQTRIVGSATGPLLDWLKNSTFPEESRFAARSYAEQVAGEFLGRLAAAGTTTAFVYGSVHADASDALFAAAHASGARIIAGPVLMDRNAPENLLVGTSAAMRGVAELVERWHGVDNGRLEVAVIPRFALTCSPKMLRAAGEYADARKLRVSTHLSENLTECEVAKSMFGTADYLSVYEDAGLLHSRSIFAHTIHLSESEWARFARSGAAIAHCPDSNFFLGSGRMPIDKVRTLDIPYGIGTDVAAGRSFRIPMSLSSAYDNALAQDSSLTPTELLWAGTGGGAAALGISDIGTLAAGQWADIAAFPLPEYANDAMQALSAVIFNHDTGSAVRTWVRGAELFARDK